MTLPPSALSDGDATSRRGATLALVLTGVLIGLKAFALGASGSLSVLAALAESVLSVLGLAAVLFPARWQGFLPPMPAAHADAISALLQSGMAMAAAVFIGTLALFGLFDPRPVGGGLWGVGAIILALGFTAVLASLQAASTLSRRDRMIGLAVDLVPGLIVLIGLIGGAYLGASGLDAVAALTLSVWLFWGALGPIRQAARHLVRI